MSLLSLLYDLFMSHSEGVSEFSKTALAGFARLWDERKTFLSPQCFPIKIHYE